MPASRSAPTTNQLTEAWGPSAILTLAAGALWLGGGSWLPGLALPFAARLAARAGSRGATDSPKSRWPEHCFWLLFVTTVGSIAMASLPASAGTWATTAVLVIALVATERLLQRSHRQLDRLAGTDELTSLANRRGLRIELDRAIQFARRYELPLTVCYCDLDRFKALNDTFGHAIGDLVLRRFADHLRDGLRDTDLAGRLGGDEFCIVMPNTDIEQAERAILRLRQQIEAKDDLRGVTATFGIASWRDGQDLQRLLHAADQALYAGKRRERGGVAIQTASTQTGSTKTAPVSGGGPRRPSKSPSSAA